MVPQYQYYEESSIFYFNKSAFECNVLILKDKGTNILKLILTNAGTVPAFLK